MRILFIMPWYCRPCAISKHVRNLIGVLLQEGHQITVASIFNDEWNEDDDRGINLIKVKYKSSRLFSGVVSRVSPDLLKLPDVYRFSLKRKMTKQILKDVDFTSIDCIHSVCWPCTSHLIAREIKMRTNKPWIAQFYDPWVDNPYRKIRKPFFKRKDEELEYLVAKDADMITHLTPVTLKIWNDRYGKMVEGKQCTLYMTYEKNLYEKAETIPTRVNEGKVVISYIGKLFYDRNLQDIIAALELLRNEIPKLEEMLCIRIVGLIEAADRRAIKEKQMDRIFDLVPYVPSDQLEKYYIDSDAFLMIESPQKRNVFFSSKLLDYFIYKRLVIGITPLIGITTQLLNESHNIAIENGDIEKIRIVFRDIVNHKRINEFDSHYYQQFSPNKLAKDYSVILSKITSL